MAGEVAGMTGRGWQCDTLARDLPQKRDSMVIDGDMA
jgi:hypothetical protein